MLVYLAILLAAPTVRAAPAATDLPTGWHLLEACAVDGADRVIQSSKWTRSWNNTAANCIAKCNTQGYAFAGLEYGVECHCGKGISADIVSAPVSECSTLCPGDNTQTCGAGWRISLYAKDVNTMPVYSLPTGWSTLMECAYDSAARLFTDTQVNYLTTNTPSVCASHCADGGYAYSGVEYGRECYCGNTLATSLVARPDSDCYMDCAGDATQNCGGNWAVQLYSNPSLVASRSASASASASTTSTSGSPTSSSVAFPSDWSVLHACSVDNGNRILPQTNTLNDNTPARCAQLCYSRGYKVSGTEYGRECYCGDSFSFPPVDRPASECSFACTGDATQKCGAGWRIQLVGDSSLGSSTTTSTSAGPSATADPLGLPSGWQTAYRCAIDDASRILGQFNTLSNNSPSNCAEVCSDKGYHIAAVEYGGECMCGDSFNFAP
ncbi:WSC-domain-containing protein, partial [Exidia glandulosa HHB12029]